jgi:rubrerythrin
MALHRKTKRCINYNYKTTTTGSTIPVTSPGVVGSPLAVVESKSKIITEINMNKEFDKMSNIFNSAKKDEENEKKYKYKCEKCSGYFNLPADGKCPLCGE